MSLPVSLKHATDEIDGPGSVWAGWINRKTGELVFIPDEDGAVGREAFEEDVERVESSDDFIAMPGRHEFPEYRHMEQFSLAQSNTRVRERLLDALGGKGAFRRFKDTALRLGVRDAWFEYRYKRLAEHVADFLALNDIAYIDDVGLPKRPDVDDDEEGDA